MDDQHKKDEQAKPEASDAAKTPEASAEKPAVTLSPETPSETSKTYSTPAAPEAETSAESTPQPIAPDVGYTETKSSKLVYIFVGLLLVILLSLVGLFFYKQMMVKPSESQISPTPIPASPTVAVSPTLTPANDEEAELQQIDIPDVDQDLQQIESDLNQL